MTKDFPAEQALDNDDMYQHRAYKGDSFHLLFNNCADFVKALFHKVIICSRVAGYVTHPKRCHLKPNIQKIDFPYCKYTEDKRACLLRIRNMILDDKGDLQRPCDIPKVLEDLQGDARQNYYIIAAYIHPKMSVPHAFVFLFNQHTGLCSFGRSGRGRFLKRQEFIASPDPVLRKHGLGGLKVFGAMRVDLDAAHFLSRAFEGYKSSLKIKKY